MRCKVCGTEVKENQRFCPTCGLLIDLSFSPFQNIEVQPEPEKDEEPEFLKQQMLAQEEAESEEESVENLPLKKNVDEFLEEQKEAGELEYAPEEEPIQENSVQDNLEKDIPEQEKLEQSLSTQEFLSQEELSQEELSQEEVLEEDVSQKELEEKAVQAEAVKESVASEEKEETDTAALSKEQEETGTDTLSGEKEETDTAALSKEQEEIDRDALSEEQEEASFIEAFFREKEEHGEEESQPEETQVQESIQEEAEQEGLKEETSEQEISAQEEAGIQEFVPEVFTEEDSKEDSHGDELQEKEPQKDESQEDEPQEDESQEDESQEDESQEDELQEKDPQEEESQEEEGPLEDESITLIERGLFREEVQEDEEEPEEKILSLQEKRKEMEEKLAFEGEIPDDPDDFQDKAAIPPTSVGEWKKGWQKWKKAAPLAIIPVLGIAYICYQNLPATQYDNLLKKGTKLVQSEKGDEAIALLEGMPSNLTKNSKYYLLLSEAYGKAGRHQEAVKALEEAKKLYPEDTEVQTALSLLDPKVESDLQGDSFTDPVEISLKSSGKKIIYSISGGKEDIQNEEYLAPIKLSRNGNYTLTAYAQASDGSMGESYSKSFSISLDPEKYHLSQFVDEEGGRSYIDENGDRVTGWKEIAGKYYYFDENGIMQSDFQDIGGERYYLNSDGTMQTGRLDLEGKTYFFDQDGHMIKDAWVDNLYYVGEDGVMLRNQENKEGVHFDEDGRRAFLAADLYAAHPDSIVVVESKQRKEHSSYYLFPAKVYYQKKNGRASGKVAYETEIKVSKMAMMSYLDENLPSITAKDAVSFLPTLSMQNIKQNKDGVVTSFAFVLGERRS
ncbi:tetratricopeptide repeat protein [Oribacterium sinus]|uniref:Cell wall-binding protein n=1 Tax=Oribacterium sinus TaxID=237576 RepID=A0A930DK93_9FIRM|nr:tetratricopeptide repeat protein [Oribacterium sinus]MBF1272898.1 cell wall-binding protein [Oribacterium sinus]